MVLTEDAKNIIWRIMRENNMDTEPQTKPKVTQHADQPHQADSQNPGEDQTSPHNPMPTVGGQASSNLGANPQPPLGEQGGPLFVGQHGNPHYPSAAQIHHMSPGQQGHMAGVEQGNPLVAAVAEAGNQVQAGDGMTMPQYHAGMQ
jgi:hypothetical protein